MCVLWRDLFQKSNEANSWGKKKKKNLHPAPGSLLQVWAGSRKCVTATNAATGLTAVKEKLGGEREGEGGKSKQRAERMGGPRLEAAGRGEGV